MVKYTFDEAESRLLSALKWIEDQGISTKRTRLSRYLKDIREGNLIDEQNVGRFVNAVLEINELCDIHAGLSDVTLGKAYKNKLRKYCAGPDDYFMEGKTKNNQARDFGFELAVASNFAQNGFPLDTSNEGADVLTSQKDQDWIVECKRPRRQSSVRGNARAGYSQLRRRFKEAQREAYGVVAISMTKAVMGELRMAMNATNRDAKNMAMTILDEQVAKYGSQLKRLDNRSRNVLGLIFRLILPYGNITPGEVGTYTGHAIVSFYHDGTEEFKAFRGIAKALSKENLDIRLYD